MLFPARRQSFTERYRGDPKEFRQLPKGPKSFPKLGLACWANIAQYFKTFHLLPLSKRRQHALCCPLTWKEVEETLLQSPVENMEWQRLLRRWEKARPWNDRQPGWFPRLTAISLILIATDFGGLVFSELKTLSRLYMNFPC